MKKIYHQYHQQQHFLLLNNPFQTRSKRWIGFIFVFADEIGFFVFSKNHYKKIKKVSEKKID